MAIIRSIAKVALGNEIMRRSEGSGILKLGVGALAVRVATRSIPGALLVGGAYLGKKLYDRRKARNLPVSEMIVDQQLASEKTD